MYVMYVIFRLFFRYKALGISSLEAAPLEVSILKSAKTEVSKISANQDRKATAFISYLSTCPGFIAFTTFLHI